MCASLPHLGLAGLVLQCLVITVSCRVDSPFLRHVGRVCLEKCTENGNCNGDTGQCDCAFGYEGPACEHRVMPACHTSLAIRTPPLYGTWSLKNCNCFRQLARIGCPPVGDRECLYDALWNVSMACFEVEGLVPEQQTSDVPRDGFAHPSLRWYWGQPLLGSDAMNRTAPPTHHLLPNKLYQLPLDACPQRCSERGFCGGQSADSSTGTCTCVSSYTGEMCEKPVQEDCYLSCAGGARAGLPNGTCIQGFCHCPAGRWGLACTRDEYYTSSGGWLPSHAGLRIFVYTLPMNVVHPKYNDGMFSLDSMYLAEQAFTSELLADDSSGLVTQNPWEANMFLVPTWSFWYTGNVVTPLRLFRHVINHLKTNYPFWDGMGGRNHVMWALNDRGSCDWHHLESDIKRPIIMTHFGQAPRRPGVHLLMGSEEVAELLRVHHKAIKRTQWEPMFKGFLKYTHMDSYNEQMPCYRPEKDVVVPPVTPHWVMRYNDLVYGNNHDRFNRSVHRGVTFFFSGSNRADQMFYSQGVRQAIAHVTGPIGTERHLWERPDFLINPLGHPKATMARSKFCLAPSGWGWGVRLAEAVAVGCVPVIVQDHVYQFLWDVLPYDQFSVVVGRRDLHRLPEILDSVSPHELATLQDGLARWHRALLYRHQSPHGLAYNFTVLALRRRLTSLRSAHY